MASSQNYSSENKLYFIVTENCTNSCVSCINQRHRLHGNILPSVLDPWGSLEKIKASGTTSEYMQVSILGGETYLYKDIVEFTKACRETFPNARLFILTSLSFSEKYFEKAVRPTLPLLDGIIVSMYSDKAEEHDAVTGRKGSWQMTRDNFIRIANSPYKPSKKLQIATVLTKFTDNRIYELSQYFFSLGARHFCPSLMLLDESYYEESKDIIPSLINIKKEYEDHIDFFRENENRVIFGLMPRCIVSGHNASNGNSTSRGGGASVQVEDHRISEEMMQFKYLEQCRECHLFGKCFGIRWPYRSIYSDIIKPIKGA